MRRNLFLTLTSFLALCLMMAGCKSSCVNTILMVGVLDMPLQQDSVSANVKKAMDNAIKFHSHEIISDTTANIAVFAIDEIDQTPSEGHGIMVTKGAETTLQVVLWKVRAFVWNGFIRYAFKRMERHI